MKLIDLAKLLDTSIEELLKYYNERHGIEIPKEEEYILTFEIAKKANWRLTPETFESFINSEEAPTKNNMQEFLVGKEENFKLKNEVIEDIKKLSNSEETKNKTFQKFRELQQRWHEIGPVPQAEIKNLWDKYHLQVEKFYENIKINKELRDLDLKKNLELKIRLCEKAEELLIETSINRAFRTFQHYRKQWREIGPVPQDQKDKIKDRFSKITFNINRKHQDFIEGIEKTKENKLQPDKILYEKINVENQLYQDFYNWSDKKIFEEILIHNKINSLLLKGRYTQGREGDNFGFFNDVKHIDNFFLSYPYSFGDINSIFILNSTLEHGVTYTFEAILAKKKNRIDKGNPFLVQANRNSLKEIIELSEIEKYIEKKNAEKIELELSVQDLINETEKQKEELLNLVEDLKIEKQQEVNSIIEEYNVTIQEKFNDIQKREKQLNSLNESVIETKNQLQTMENLISTLMERISLCRNLQFLSEDDESKYLNLLSAKEIQPENHLDFEQDFELNFSKLSEHIHSYLYHKSNLIYTQFQIKNFLTLLRTHDLIVLSGLSGSGKTQIVKAFAEALGGVAKIIPVKPNWTSSDDLIGYYNPLQMSFLPTPFTEAIVEAIHNPNQLYFICLDEMNLARTEYYFADFLSKLEERSKEPEIELYAHHEEELFVSEFSTLLNLIESSIKGMQIKSWQEFLDNEDARKKFFEMLGNTDKESMLQLHSKMKRRLIDILKFPSTIRIPDNVRFIGAINVDETTHYFSPKILDRIHVIKFDNPLLFEEQVNSWFENTENEKELKPVYVRPDLFSKRTQYPKINEEGSEYILAKLKEINQNFLLPLNIDFGIRSMRQSINYSNILPSSFQSIMDNVVDSVPDSYEFYNEQEYFKRVSLNSIIMQKIFPRFIFDGSETAKNGESKVNVLEEFHKFLSTEFKESYFNNESDIGKSTSEYLKEMINQANRNNSQFNFFA